MRDANRLVVTDIEVCACFSNAIEATEYQETKNRKRHRQHTGTSACRFSVERYVY